MRRDVADFFESGPSAAELREALDYGSEQGE